MKTLVTRTAMHFACLHSYPFPTSSVALIRPVVCIPKLCSWSKNTTGLRQQFSCRCMLPTFNKLTQRQKKALG